MDRHNTADSCIHEKSMRSNQPKQNEPFHFFSDDEENVYNLQMEKDQIVSPEPMNQIFEGVQIAAGVGNKMGMLVSIDPGSGKSRTGFAVFAFMDFGDLDPVAVLLGVYELQYGRGERTPDAEVVDHLLEKIIPKCQTWLGIRGPVYLLVESVRGVAASANGYIQLMFYRSKTGVPDGVFFLGQNRAPEVVMPIDAGVNHETRQRPAVRPGILSLSAKQKWENISLLTRLFDDRFCAVVVLREATDMELLKKQLGQLRKDGDAYSGKRDTKKGLWHDDVAHAFLNALGYLKNNSFVAMQRLVHDPEPLRHAAYLEHLKVVPNAPPPLALRNAPQPRREAPCAAFVILDTGNVPVVVVVGPQNRCVVLMRLPEKEHGDTIHWGLGETRPIASIQRWGGHSIPLASTSEYTYSMSTVDLWNAIRDCSVQNAPQIRTNDAAVPKKYHHQLGLSLAQLSHYGIPFLPLHACVGLAELKSILFATQPRRRRWYCEMINGVTLDPFGPLSILAFLYSRLAILWIYPCTATETNRDGNKRVHQPISLSLSVCNSLVATGILHGVHHFELVATEREGTEIVTIRLGLHGEEEEFAIHSAEALCATVKIPWKRDASTEYCLYLLTRWGQDVEVVCGNLAHVVSKIRHGMQAGRGVNLRSDEIKSNALPNLQCEGGAIPCVIRDRGEDRLLVPSVWGVWPPAVPRRVTSVTRNAPQIHWLVYSDPNKEAPGHKKWTIHKVRKSPNPQTDKKGECTVTFIEAGHEKASNIPTFQVRKKLKDAQKLLSQLRAEDVVSANMKFVVHRGSADEQFAVHVVDITGDCLPGGLIPVGFHEEGMVNDNVLSTRFRSDHSSATLLMTELNKDKAPPEPKDKGGASDAGTENYEEQRCRKGKHRSHLYGTNHQSPDAVPAGTEESESRAEGLPDGVSSSSAGASTSESTPNGDLHTPIDAVAALDVASSSAAALARPAPVVAAPRQDIQPGRVPPGGTFYRPEEGSLQRAQRAVEQAIFTRLDDQLPVCVGEQFYKLCVTVRRLRTVSRIMERLMYSTRCAITTVNLRASSLMTRQARLSKTLNTAALVWKHIEGKLGDPQYAQLKRTVDYHRYNLNGQEVERVALARGLAYRIGFNEIIGIDLKPSKPPPDVEAAGWPADPIAGDTGPTWQDAMGVTFPHLLENPGSDIDRAFPTPCMLVKDKLTHNNLAMLSQTGEGAELLHRTRERVKETLKILGNNGTALHLPGRDRRLRYISRDGLRSKSDQCKAAIEMLNSPRECPPAARLEPEPAKAALAILTTHYEGLTRSAAECRMLLKESENTIRSVWSSNVGGHFKCDNNLIVRASETGGEKPYILLKRSIRRKPLAEIALDCLVHVKETQPELFFAFHPITEMVLSDAIKERYDLQGGRRQRVARLVPMRPPRM
jgi:hypothetical protein